MTKDINHFLATEPADSSQPTTWSTTTLVIGVLAAGAIGYMSGAATWTGLNLIAADRAAKKRGRREESVAGSGDDLY